MPDLLRYVGAGHQHFDATRRSGRSGNSPLLTRESTALGTLVVMVVPSGLTEIGEP